MPSAPSAASHLELNATSVFVAVEDQERLVGVRLGVRRDLFRATARAASRCGRSGRRSATVKSPIEEHDVVAEILQLPQLVELHRVAEMQVRPRRIEAFLDVQRLAARELGPQFAFDQQLVGAAPETRRCDGRCRSPSSARGPLHARLRQKGFACLAREALLQSAPGRRRDARRCACPLPQVIPLITHKPRILAQPFRTRIARSRASRFPRARRSPSRCSGSQASRRSASRPTRRSTRFRCAASRARCRCRPSRVARRAGRSVLARRARAARRHDRQPARARDGRRRRRDGLPAHRSVARARSTSCARARAQVATDDDGRLAGLRFLAGERRDRCRSAAPRRDSGAARRRRRRHAPHDARRRNPVVAVRGGRRRRTARRHHAGARRRLRRRHRLLSRPAPRRSLHRAVRDALRRRRAGGHRTHRRSRIREPRHRAIAHSCGARRTAPRVTTTRRRAVSRKAFLRSPMEFSRITSGFTQARFHPILHTLRAHKGTDFAAPIGTPVRATADGV